MGQSNMNDDDKVNDDGRFIYLDNHSTTRVDPRVLAEMLPVFESDYANPSNLSHGYGERAAERVAASRELVAQAIGATVNEIVFTSGATESNHLALLGFCRHARNTRRIQGKPRIVTLCTEHRAVLDPLKLLQKDGFEVLFLPVSPGAGDRNVDRVGQVDLDRLKDALTDSTVLVSVMLANNEIGVLQPLQEISTICRERGVAVHSDATQAIGRMQVDVRELGVDLLSLSAHKFYGPKGIGALYIRQQTPRVRLSAQLVGGGQESGLRSGTLNVPGIVGMGAAMKLQDLTHEPDRIRGMASRFFSSLQRNFESIVRLNGPAMDSPSRLAGNVNCQFSGMHGQTLMMKLPNLALSSGSACSAANSEPSHVLTGIGLGLDEVQSSVRFGFGRFNDDSDVDIAIGRIVQAVERLRPSSG